MSTKKTASDTNTGSVFKPALAIFIIGCVLMAGHHLLLSKQSLSSDENWSITFDINWHTEQPGSLLIQPPFETEFVRLHSRNITHSGLRISPPPRSTLNKRAIRLKAKQPGSYSISLQYALQYSDAPHFHPATNLQPSALLQQHYLTSNQELFVTEDTRLDDALERIRKPDSDDKMLVDSIYQLSRKLRTNKDDVARSAPEILASGKANNLERAIVMVALARKASIQARLVTGLILQDDPSASPTHWVETYLNDQWVIYHPGLGYQSQLPPNFVAFDQFGNGILSARHKSDVENPRYTLEYDIQIERIPASIANPDSTRHVWYQVFMLDRLPAETRSELALLMLLPLGALLTCAIRQFGGIHSYGVFTPTILALAMVYVDWLITSLVLFIIIAMAFLGRPAFNSKMPRTPRLSIIFTLVAISMVFGVSILDYFELASEGHLILLPIVILTSLIDRFFSTVENLGYQAALIRLVWTIIITLLILPIFSLLWVGAWFLRYPEAHLFTLSLFILISAYPFKQRQLPGWFSVLSEPEVVNKKKSKSSDSSEIDK